MNKKIFIGWDPREDIAYQVCKHSIKSNTPTATVCALKQSTLRKENIYTRPHDAKASTEFTFTRYLIPELMHFKGWAVFVDCDVIANVDLEELFRLRDDRYAVMCVKHKYTPAHTKKMDNQRQYTYLRKNWSSVMLINCGHPSNKKLTKELVNDTSKSGLWFHQFKWLKDSEIGELPHTWNYLVDVYNDIDTPNIVHYTNGGPWFEKYRNCTMRDFWVNNLIDMYNAR